MSGVCREGTVPATQRAWWTSERAHQLRMLWRQGLSAGEIADMLGISRNAIIGKAHRLGLESRPSPIGMTRKKRAAAGYAFYRP